MGTWLPAHGGGWQWISGMSPPQWLINDYGLQVLENPNVDPAGVVPSTPVNPPAPPPDTETPVLTQVWTTAPHVPGPDSPDPLSGNSGKGSTTYLAATPFTVSPGSIEQAENEILAATSTAVTAYDAWAGMVQDTEDWVFSINNPGLFNDTARQTKLYVPGDLPNQDVTNQFIPAQHQALKGAGDAIELAGKFVAWLNDAAQSYAVTDQASFLPSPTSNTKTT